MVSAVGAHPDHGAVVAGGVVASGVRVGFGAYEYEVDAGWCKLPDDRALGNTHGGIVIDGDGLVYYNTDTDRSIMVHEPDGSFVRSMCGAYPALHSMVLREEAGRSYIYGAHLPGKQVLKLRLDGTLVWALGVPMESGKYEDPNRFNPTSVAVAPDGRLYVADGYGENWIHIFGSDLTYRSSFGGRGKEPGEFVTCHGIALYEGAGAPMLLVCDRENRRLQLFDLDGTFVNVAAEGLRRPCSVSIAHGLIAVAELEGRVTLLDMDFKVVAHLGDNPDRSQWANNGVPAGSWRPGIFTAPHGVCFDAERNLYVQDWNATGRISKLLYRGGE